ncbi:MAG: disulfide bond formation protein B [Croceibacterium sp.]
MTPRLKLAQRLAVGVPAVLLAGAYISEYGFGLYPCEMCWWQRYAHFAAVALAFVSYLASPRKAWIALAALAILGSGMIGAFHAGVEYHWWEGFTTCSAPPGAGGGDPLEAILAAPLIRCDVAQWTLGGISLAGFNAVISIVSALAIFVLMAKDRRA